ncbi:hypothetical protein VTO73DRAFT_5083 [Trametes versicolor]
MVAAEHINQGFGTGRMISDTTLKDERTAIHTNASPFCRTGGPRGGEGQHQDEGTKTTNFKLARETFPAGHDLREAKQNAHSDASVLATKNSRRRPR